MLFGKRNRTDLTDDQLLKEFNRSGKNAFLGTLYQRYLPLVFGTCMKYLKNEAKAQDASMDIFELCAKKLKGKEIEHFKSWLYVVAKNHCLMQLRSEKKKKHVAFDQAEHRIEDQNGYDFLKESRLQKLTQTLGELKPDQKACIELFFLKNKCYQEIAVELNMEVKKVKSHIQNGKRNLKILLGKEEEFKEQ